jgi:hypothetical protein
LLSGRGLELTEWSANLQHAPHIPSARHVFKYLGREPSRDLAHAGLPVPSVVRAAKIACIEPARIERRAGRLDKATARAVAQKLKRFWGAREACGRNTPRANWDIVNDDI